MSFTPGAALRRSELDRGQSWIEKRASQVVKRTCSRGKVPHQALALPFTRYVILHRTLNLPLPQFPHPLNGVNDNYSTYVMG